MKYFNKKASLIIFCISLLSSSCSTNSSIVDSCSHSIVTDEGVAATCTEHGLTEGSHCETCGKVFEEQKIIEPLGHDVVIDDLIPSSCEKQGKTSGTHCSRCGKTLIEQEIIEATGHNYDYEKATFVWDNKGYDYSANAYLDCLNSNHTTSIDAEVTKTFNHPHYNASGHIEYKATIKDKDENAYSDNKTVEIDEFVDKKASKCEHEWIKSNTDYKSIVCKKCYEKSLPIININTENPFGHDYVDTEVSVVSGISTYDISNAKCQVKVRGNGTSTYDKKPYRLKFKSKQIMLGLNNNLEAKSWVLLAEYNGNLIKNMLGFLLAEEIMENYYSSDFAFINLYVNNHYHGVYLLAEQNQVNSGRIDIPEPAKNSDATNIGYFIEMDQYYESEDYTFDIDYGNNLVTSSDEIIPLENLEPHYTIKSDVYSDVQVNFIQKVTSNIYRIIYDSLYNDHSNLTSSPYKTLDENYDIVDNFSLSSAKEAITNVIDYESFVKMFILQELVQDYDIGWSSFFLSIDCSNEGNKLLTFQAPWDFDLGFGVVSPYEDSLYLFSSNPSWHQMYNPWFMLFANCDWFLNDVKITWNTEEYEIGNIINFVESFIYENRYIIFTDYLLWQRDITKVTDEQVFYSSYFNQTNAILDYLSQKQSFFDSYLNN